MLFFQNQNLKNELGSFNLGIPTASDFYIDPNSNSPYQLNLDLDFSKMNLPSFTTTDKALPSLTLLQQQDELKRREEERLRQEEERLRQEEEDFLKQYSSQNNLELKNVKPNEKQWIKGFTNNEVLIGSGVLGLAIVAVVVIKNRK
ncbi:hypothetical protein ACE193_15125 [Bernardetia sp. OM2101]|uniref:hypothetical protein n=1 Tax=Bernardetia sp. OM2101 TaxID=3344876 RepID=UPI0035CED03B